MRIYGHSDDCIEIDGEGLREEVYLRDGRSFLRFACGTVVRCRFGEEGRGWLFDVVTHGEGVTSVVGEPDDQLDSDLVLEGVQLPMVHDATADGPDEEQIEDFFEDFDWRDLDADVRRSVFAAARGI